jgi:hypothetical protein
MKGRKDKQKKVIEWTKVDGVDDQVCQMDENVV